MAEQEQHDHPEQQEEQNLPAEVLVGLYREEISRLLSENMDLRLEVRWKAQIVEALQQQIERMAEGGPAEPPNPGIQENRKVPE